MVGLGSRPNAVPLFTEVVRLVVVGLEPVAHLTILHGPMSVLADFPRIENIAFWGLLYHITADDHVIGEKIVQATPEWNGIALGKGLDLYAELACPVLAVNQDIDTFGVSCSRHRVPAMSR